MWDSSSLDSRFTSNFNLMSSFLFRPFVVTLGLKGPSFSVNSLTKTSPSWAPNSFPVASTGPLQMDDIKPDPITALFIYKSRATVRVRLGKSWHLIQSVQSHPCSVVSLESIHMLIHFSIWNATLPLKLNA